MRQRALMPGLVWNVRDTNPPTPRKPVSHGYIPGFNKMVAAPLGGREEREIAASYVKWYVAEKVPHWRIADLTGLSIDSVDLIALGRTYKNVRPMKPPKAAA